MHQYSDEQLVLVNFLISYFEEYVSKSSIIVLIESSLASSRAKIGSGYKSIKELKRAA
jgi:hypothetical protein